MVHCLLRPVRLFYSFLSTPPALGLIQKTASRLGRDGVVRVYDMSINNSPIMHWKADETELYCVRFSPDETNLYTLGTEDKVRCS